MRDLHSFKFWVVSSVHHLVGIICKLITTDKSARNVNLMPINFYIILNCLFTGFAIYLYMYGLVVEIQFWHLRPRVTL